jgi:high-affinity gluconate transporter
MQWVMNAFENAVKSIAMVLLIIGTGGVLKQTIIDTGIGDTIGMLMSYGNISPYIMAWLITVLIRLATGQLVGVDPALLVLVNSVVGLIIVLIISLIA